MIPLLVFILLAGVNPAQDGNGLFLAGQYSQAAAAFEQLPEAQRTAAVWNRLGMAYHLTGKAREAEAAYLRAQKVESEMPEASNNLGALYYSQRKFGEADREFRRATERNGDSAALTANLHASRYARDNDRVSRARADEAAAARPLLLESGGNRDNPEPDFLEVVLLLPGKTREQTAQHEVRADVYAARKMYEDAVIEYKRVLALDKFNASVANRLGLAYHNLKKFREAEQQYREALRLRPNLLDAMNNLAVVDYIREDFEGALGRYNKALKLQPQSVTVLRNLGACLFSLNRWEEGVRVFERALALNPRLFEPQDGVGPAIQMLQKNSAMMNFHMARIFAARGELDLAISYLFKAVDSGFDDVKLLRAEAVFKPLAEDERFGRVLQSITAPRSGLN